MDATDLATKRTGHNTVHKAPMTGRRAEDQTADKDGTTTKCNKTKEHHGDRRRYRSYNTDQSEITGGRNEPETGRRRRTDEDDDRARWKEALTWKFGRR